MKWVRMYGSGVGLAVVVALGATVLGRMLPLIGPAIFGIALGLAINSIVGKPHGTLPGIAFTSKKILQWAIILLGTGLNLAQIWQTGLNSIYVMVFTISAAFLVAYLGGRVFRVGGRLKTLVAVGTAICGASAIAAVAPIIEAEETEIAYSISTVFFFNVLAVVIFPAIGHLLHFTNQAFGLWAGTAINDTSSVVAAGYAFSSEAGAYATIVKLTRSTMIIPICFIIAVMVYLRNKREESRHTRMNFGFRRIFPWFIVWFLVASLINTLGLVPENAGYYLNILGKFMVTLALSAIGLGADLKVIRRTGLKPIALGMIVWFAVALASLAVQMVTGQI